MSISEMSAKDTESRGTHDQVDPKELGLLVKEENLDFSQNDLNSSKDLTELASLSTTDQIPSGQKEKGVPRSTQKKNKSTSGRCSGRPDDIDKRRIFRNILVVSLIFLLTFTSYGGLAALQSSLHVQQGMGVINQAVVYAVMAVSCLVLPKITILVLGHKWCMTVSLVGYILWMGANGYGVWGTMLPASIIVGVCSATLWTAHGSYFTVLAKHYARKTGQETSAVTSLFFGIFVAFFAGYNVFGSIISSTVLNSPTYGNESNVEDSDLTNWCGLNDCPGNALNHTHLTKPSSNVVWTLVGIYVAIATAAVIMSILFVDPLPASWVHDPETESLSVGQVALSSLTATAKHLCQVKQVLLIPISVYSGMQYVFLEAEFTKSFVSCFLAIWMVGWCLIPGALCRSLGSFLSGRIAKYTGIIPIFIYGLAVDLSFQLTIAFWSPSPSQPALFFILPCFCTLADAVWHPQVKALCGVLFTEDTTAAFAAYQMFTAIGAIIAFAYSSFLCTSVKLYILMSIFGLGVSMLFVLVFVYVRPRGSKPLVK